MNNLNSLYISELENYNNHWPKEQHNFYKSAEHIF
jgi:hypothetical protein